MHKEIATMEPSVRLQRATLTESATSNNAAPAPTPSAPRKPPDPTRSPLTSQTEPPAGNDGSQSLSPSELRNIAASVFSESRDVANTRNYRKWRSMRKRDLAVFYAEHQQTFLRRMRRGVPQRFRWEAWKEAVQLRSVLQASNLDPVIPLLPCGEESWRRTSAQSSQSSEEAASSAFGRERLEELQDSTTPVELFQMLACQPSKFAALIDIDIARTFPEISLFDLQAQKSLHNILNAYANFAPHVGYCQGMNFVMGFVMLVSGFAPEVECFWFFATLMSRYHLHGFFREGFPLLDTYINTFDQLAEHYTPDLRKHFAKENVLPPVYLHQWYLTLFVTSLPLGTVVVIWDFYLSIGLHALLPVTLALLKVLQSFLLRLRFEGIVKFLKSLRSSGDCDESKIGKMLVRQAEHFPILEQFRSVVIDVDLAKLLGSPPRSYRRSVDGTSLVDFGAIVNASHAELNPLNVALKDTLHDDADDDDADSVLPPSNDAWGNKPPDEPRRSMRFLPKVIGHRKA